MKTIGKTLDGDLIIQVSQVEWDGLQDGVRPQDDRYLSPDEVERWRRSEVYQGLETMKLPGLNWRPLGRSLKRGKFDGTWESLKVYLNTEHAPFGKVGLAKLRNIAQQQLTLKNEP